MPTQQSAGGRVRVGLAVDADDSVSEAMPISGANDRRGQTRRSPWGESSSKGEPCHAE